jgi:hypothetical protein
MFKGVSYWHLIFAWMAVPSLTFLVLIFLVRRLYRDFPFFFLFVVASAFIGAMRFIVFALGPSPLWYFYLYWCTDFALMVTCLLAIYELFVKRLFPNFLKVGFYRFLFPFAALIIAVLTFFTALQSPNPSASLLIAARTFYFLRTAAIVFFVALMLFMGRRWTRYEFGIALGIGIQASASLITEAMRTLWHYFTPFDRVSVVVYDIGCLVWIVAFWRAADSGDGASVAGVNPQALKEARKWEGTLKDWLMPRRR